MKRVHESESFYFEDTEGLIHFLKEEQYYEDKDIDLLLKEKFEEDEEYDAHEKTTTIVRLVPDNSGGFTINFQQSRVLFDNYS